MPRSYHTSARDFDQFHNREFEREKGLRILFLKLQAELYLSGQLTVFRSLRRRPSPTAVIPVRSMTTLLMFHGRQADEMVQRLRQIKENRQRISTLAVRETVIGPSVMDAIVDVLRDGQVPVDSVHLDDCGAYLNTHAAAMAKVLGHVHSLRLSEPTFLSQFFLDSLLQSATNLSELHIQDHLYTAQIDALSRGLETNESLRVLDLSRSRLEDISILCRGLRENECLQELHLKSIGLDDRHVQDLLNAIQYHPKIDLIDLSFNHCRTMDHVAHFLEHNATVRTMSVGYMNVWQASKVDVKYFLESMQTNTSLTSLSLGWDKLDDRDAEYIADMLRANSTLRSLDLKDNRLSDAALTSLADALLHNATLRSLDVANNPYTAIGLQALHRTVLHTAVLEHVGLSPGDPLALAKELDYDAALNQGGRRAERADLPLSVWPHVLQRIRDGDWERRRSEGRAGPEDALFYHLRGPLLFEGVLCRPE